jgi:hypothetical protein
VGWHPGRNAGEVTPISDVQKQSEVTWKIFADIRS